MGKPKLALSPESIFIFLLHKPVQTIVNLIRRFYIKFLMSLLLIVPCNPSQSGVFLLCGEVTYDPSQGRKTLDQATEDNHRRVRIDAYNVGLCFEYPNQWSNIDDEIKHWLFVLPIDERTTRAFFCPV